MQHVVQEVIDGRADAGVVRTCFLEDLTTHKGVLLPLKVVEPYSDSKFACSRSTELYPNWTISSVPSLTAPELRRMFEILCRCRRHQAECSGPWRLTSVRRIV